METNRELIDIQDVMDAGQGVVSVDHNMGDDRAPLTRVRHLLYNPHARPLFGSKEAMPLPRLPSSMPHLRGFFETELGKDVLAYSYLRADTGSTEIGRAILEALAKRGEDAMMISSNVIGRGVLDPNRPTARALDFHVPGVVAKELLAVHGIITGLLDKVFDTVRPDLRSVFQPHTMGSGNLTDGEGGEAERFTELTKQIKESVREGAYDDEALVRANLEELSHLYGLMNNRRERSHVDVLKNIVMVSEGKPLTNEDGSFKTGCLPDIGVTSMKLAKALDAAGIPWAYDNPFPHVPGYPGSELAFKAAMLNVPQGTLDVPRYLLQTDPGVTVDTLTFRPDPARVEAIAKAVVNALAF